MKFDKLKIVKDIEEMIEEIDYMNRNLVFLSEKEITHLIELQSYVSKVWLWYTNKVNL